MENLKQELLALCAMDKANIIENIINFRLERILLEDVKELNAQLFEETEIFLLEQKIKNYFFVLAHREIATLLQEIDARVIFIKGMVLAEDLYENQEVRRSGDIDVIIDKENVKPILEILGKHAWCLCDTGMPLTYDILSDKDIDTIIARMCHLSEIKKDFRIPGGLTRSVMVDLHIRIYNDFNFESTYMTDIKNRCVEYRRLGVTTLQLELHDKLLHLLCSFTKEHIDTLAKYILLGSSPDHVIEVNLLYDIALLIIKYDDKIDWNIIIDRVRILEKDGELLFAIRMFNFVFHNLIPLDLETLLKKNLDQYFSCKLTDGLKRRCIPYLVNVAPEYFFKNHFSNIYKECLDNLEWIGPEISIFPNCDKQSTHVKCEISDTAKSINFFDSYYKFNSKNLRMSGEKFNFKLAFNKQGIILNIQKEYLKSEMDCLENEHFWITIGGANLKQQGIIPFTMKRFEFNLCSANSLTCLDGVPSGGTIYNIRTRANDEYTVVSACKGKDGYMVELLLTWEMVQINYENCDEFWFDFEGEISNGGLVCFANPCRVMFDDPSLLCKVKLENKQLNSH